jgi:hypothetical protein
VKTLVLGFFLLVLPCAAQTSVTPGSATPTAATQNLKDEFAKSAFRVLRMIEGESGEGGMSSDGRMTVPRETNQAISDLDIDAQTKEDQAIVKVLNDFFLAKTAHNTQISILSEKAKWALYAARQAAAPPISQDWRHPATESPLEQQLRNIQPSDVVAMSPTVIAIHDKEAACSAGLEAVLRARNYQEVASCHGDALEVPTPDKLDVPIEAVSSPEVKLLLGNSKAGTSSPAAAAALAIEGHFSSSQEMQELIQKGEASQSVVITIPAGAKIWIDNNEAGVTPMAFVLYRHGDTPRSVKVTLDGYKTVEQLVVPDGKIIPISLTLESK